MAYYDFKKKPALTTKEGEKDVLYPSIVFNGTINTKQLLKQLVARTGYKPGVVEGTLMELVDLVGEYIGQGYRVEVGEFGYFSGKIKSRLVKDKKDLRSPSIQFNGVNFLASKTFKLLVYLALLAWFRNTNGQQQRYFYLLMQDYLNPEI